MRVTFNPFDGTEEKSWEFDPEDVLQSDAEGIEKAYGQSWEIWLHGLRTGEAKARRVLLWQMLREDHRAAGGRIKLRFDDTPDFRMKQLKLEMSSDEMRELDRQIRVTLKDEDVLAAYDAAFNRDLQEALHREGKAVEGEIEPAPKAS
jgi:hypothetical protein